MYVCVCVCVPGGRWAGPPGSRMSQRPRPTRDDHIIISFFSPIFRMQCVSTVLIHHIKPLLLIIKRNIYLFLKVMPDGFFLHR